MTTRTAEDRKAQAPSAPDRLAAAQYFGYAGGDAANNLTFTLVSMFLLVYYTDAVGIEAAAAGTILLVARVWGAFTDVFAGRLVDRTITRWGRFRPYFLFAGIPLMLLAVAVFSLPGRFSGTTALVLAYLTLLAFYLVYSLVNIPYGSLAAAMTELPDERARLSGARSMGSAVAIIGLTAVVAPQISRAANLERSLTLTTSGFAVLGIALYVFLFGTSRETVRRDSEPVSIREDLGALRRNKALLLLCLSAMSVLTGLFVMQTLQIYYARDVLGNAGYTIVLTALTTGAMLVVAPAVPRIVEAVGKKRAYIISGAITVVGGAGIGFSPPSMLTVVFLSFAVYGVGISALQALIWALQADTVEYGEWRSGVRTEGTDYAALSFTRKVGQGIGGALAAYSIGVAGYHAGSTAQPAGALQAIRYVTGWGPAIFVGIGAAVMLAYPLTEARFQRIVTELAARHEGDGDAADPAETDKEAEDAPTA
jgi:glucuronide carrier protein